MRLLWLLLPLILSACSMRVQEKEAKAHPPTAIKVVWPQRTPAHFAQKIKSKHPLHPHFIHTPHGEIVTYGSQPDGSEHFAVISQREKNPKPGLFQLRLCFLPTSIFAGPSPLQPNLNELHSSDRKWCYSAYDFRSTFFHLYPALSPKPKGLLLYHTSIMLLSLAEQKIIHNFRKRGWNIIVALPPDSLYRNKLPALTSPAGTLQDAAALIAEDMDRHYAEQAFSARSALSYLAQTRPQWLQGKRVLMGTSAGTFGLPATALLNPGWDALIFISGGTNLLSLYESGSARVFKNSLAWIADARKDPPETVTRIFTDQEYHQLFRQAATMTQLHPGRLAPLLRDQRILTIAGSLDRIMPDEQALGLHRALGSPERWTAPLGHHLIALQLILEVDRLDRWIMNPPSPSPRSN